MSRESFIHETQHFDPEHQEAHEPKPAIETTEEESMRRESPPLAPDYESTRCKLTTDLEDYIDCMRIEEITKDKAETERARMNILKKEASLSPEELENSKEAKKIATMLEEITVNLGNSPAWIPNARFIKASEYDDLCKGTDLIIDIKQPKTGRPIIVAVDVTTGRNEVGKKLRSIISPGDMIFEKPSLKYHPGLKYMHEQRQNGEDVKPVAVAKLVLGASAEVIKEPYVTMRAAANANDRLAARNMNRLKYVILEGGLIQARGLRDHALSINQGQTAKIYDHIAQVFQKALEVHDHIFGAFPAEYAEKGDAILDEIKTIESTRYDPTKIAK
jgi:hypothetical protein